MTRRHEPPSDGLTPHSEPTDVSTPHRPRYWEVTLTDTTRRTFLINTDSQPEGPISDRGPEEIDFSIRGRVAYTHEEHLERWAEIVLCPEE